MRPVVAVLLKGYPRLSETFIAQELRALEERGLGLHIVSLRHPTDPTIQPVHREIRAPVCYLPEYLHREPLRVARAWSAVRRLPGYRDAASLWLADLRRDRSRNRVRRFGQACVLANELCTDTVHLHAHFLHTPSSVARYASRILGIPWSFSAHARDIWTSPSWEKTEKLNDCAWGVTCTAVNLEHLQSLASDPRRIELIYHGLDMRRVKAPAAVRHGPSFVILSVGRAVEKKGYDVLLEALARLGNGLRWEFRHVGGGKLLPRLKRTAKKLGIDTRIVWLGPQSHDRVMAQYAGADVFVLASKVARDGDRDGLPNALLEAQSQGLPCISTNISAIPELIEDERTGLLVAPDSPQGLAGALERLAGDGGLRERLGAAGRRRVTRLFSFEEGIERLLHKFPPETVVGP